MSGQDALRKRAALLSELHESVQAMKNVALAELQRLTHQGPALARALTIVAEGLAQCGEATPAAGPSPPQPARMSWLVIGAERGFCGPFNARLLEAARALRHADPGTRVLLASRRAGTQLDSSDDGIVVLPGCAAVEDMAVALDGWLAVLAEDMQDGRVIWLLHTNGTGVVRRRLLPAPDLTSVVARPAAPAGAVPPAHYLPLPVLRAALLRQVVRLLVQAALNASLEHENRARLTQMQLAQEHLEKLGNTLRRRQATLRQADITSELETLANVMAD